MRVYGEAYLFINFWMDFLSLLLAACLRGARFHGPRAAAGALLGAVYAVFARQNNGLSMSIPVFLFSILLLCWISFGRNGVFFFPYVGASMLLLGGFSDALLRRGVSSAVIMLTAGLGVFGLCRMLRIRNLSAESAWVLRIRYREKQASLPVLRDSGNLLTDSFTGQPVIVVPESAVSPLLPDGVSTHDLATLPPGWRLLPVRTVSGSGLLMCFRPDSVELVRDRQCQTIDAFIALADFHEKTALVPERLFQGFGEMRLRKEVIFHAGN
ncbi:MAG: sigma-E processing peptidase SpoIIGA [Clostridia bacterium]|nr:sigma-E processing peptidase SpoIIGA [Clostridia bacterium]